MRQLFLWCLVVGWIALISGVVVAQNPIDSAQMRSDAAYEALEKGGLIILLPSKHNKISGLEKVIAKKRGLSKTSRARYQSLLDNTIEERDGYNQALVTAFRSEYSFSKCYFAYDTVRNAIKEGQYHGFFLDDSLRIDSTIRLESDTFLLAKEVIGDRSTTTGSRGLVFMDKNFKQLEAPFPYWINYPNISYRFSKLLKIRNSLQRSMITLVNSVQDRLREP